MAYDSARNLSNVSIYFVKSFLKSHRFQKYSRSDYSKYFSCCTDGKMNKPHGAVHIEKERERDRERDRERQRERHRERV